MTLRSSCRTVLTSLLLAACASVSAGGARFDPVAPPFAAAEGGAADPVVAAVIGPPQAGPPESVLQTPPTDAAPVRFEAIYKASLWSGLAGPLRGRAAYLGNLELKLTLTGLPPYGLPGNTVFAHLLHNHGSKPNRRVGAAPGIDSTEVATNTGKLYQLWMQQQFADDRLSVLAGLYDLNSEFYVTDASTMFVHPALGIGTELSQSGRNGPSIFPTTSVGLRLRVEPAA